MRRKAGLMLGVAAAIGPAALAHAGEAVAVPHGMIVTTDTGQQVRVLGFADGTFRVTMGRHAEDAETSLMVVQAANGAPTFAATADTATLRLPQARAEVRLSDGQLRVFDAAEHLLLDENAAVRRLDPVKIEGQDWLTTRVQFNRGTDEGLYGLGQHQNRQMNYNGEDVELAQHNMAIAVPYLLSTRGYGLLWDNNSITRVGDPQPYQPVETGWTAQYYLGDRLVLTRPEKTIDYQYIRDQAKWPAEAKAQTTAATGGQNTQGNAVQTQRVVWTGSFVPQVSGQHKFQLYSSSYVKVFADGKQVLSRWRQNWNPWYHNFRLTMTKGKPVKLRIEWEPNQGYMSLFHADPLPAPDRHSVSFASDAAKTIDYYVVPGKDMDALVAGYRRLTGKAPMMPRWAYGFWQSRQRYQTQNELVDTLRQYRQEHIPIDAIVQDWFYWPENAWGSHTFDPVRFPDPVGMVDAVHRLNGRVMISVWPKFYPDTANAKELAAKGFLYQRPLTAGQRDWVGPGYANTDYDPYSPEARAIYFRQMRDSLVTKGFDAWWMDATEPDMHSNLSVQERAWEMGPTADGRPGAAVFNSYPLVHAAGVADGLRAAQPDRRPFILTRSGFGGTQRASAAVWSGDVAARWDDLRDQISAGLNLSISGIPNWTHDIGGFAVEERYSKADPTPADKAEWHELYLRWFQFGAFSPLFRSHGEFPYRETPLVAAGDSAMRDALLHYDQLRYRLLPYIYTLAAQTHFADGTIMRPLVMDFAGDRKTWGIDDQYLFGPALLVAPVTAYRERQRRLYLPTGADWFDTSTGKLLTGGKAATVAAPRERLPLLARAGSIIPMGPAVEWTSQDPQGLLTIHVFAGKDAQFTLYEDQGEDMGYARGEAARVALNWNDAQQELTIGARQGAFPGMAVHRRIGLVVHRRGDPPGDMLGREPIVLADYSGAALILKR